MKVFHCDHCDQLVFFENTQCVDCGHVLAYLPDLAVVGSLNEADDNTLTSPLPLAKGQRYRRCANYANHDICNWVVSDDDPHPLCESCRLTQVIPDLSQSSNKTAWYKLEVAKRRLLYTLMSLDLPIVNREEDPDGGLAFEFLADPVSNKPEDRVLTGHADGLITVNIAEADDAERERRRLAMHEPYRTLLGHLRHESGHYYWDKLLRDDKHRLAEFRELFGDERRDYSEALKAHHASGPPANWEAEFVSAYASSHPWEDWAESWAHYLHMIDALETANCAGLSLKPDRADEPTMKRPPRPQSAPFEWLLAAWHPLTYLMNNLNRGLGLLDAYPFVLSAPAVAKLRFVHETVIELKIED